MPSSQRLELQMCANRKGWSLSWLPFFFSSTKENPSLGKSHLLGKTVWDSGVCFQDRKNHRPVETVNIQQKGTYPHTCIYSSPLPAGAPSWCSHTLYTASKACQTEGEVGVTTSKQKGKYTKWDFFSLKGFQAIREEQQCFCAPHRSKHPFNLLCCSAAIPSDYCLPSKVSFP